MIKVRDPAPSLPSRVTSRVTPVTQAPARSHADRQKAYRVRQKVKAAAWEPPEILVGECLE